MRDNVIDLVTRLGPPVNAEDASPYDRFLIDEGLELLALFREISDQAIRRSVVEMVIALAKASAHLNY